MFKSLRWRLTVWFVILTTIVYVFSIVLAGFFFKKGLTDVIEDEIQALVSEIEPAIGFEKETPTLHEWANTSVSVPFKFLPTIQLYDKDGVLIERYGQRGVQQLYKDGGELRAGNHQVKVYSTPLLYNGKVRGYLQIQLNLRNRDRAVSTFTQTMVAVSPFLLTALAFAGYLFSAKAARPIEENFQLLRSFMSDAGHELGTPISIIQANAEAMESDLPEQENVRSRLAVITRSTDRLGSLVRDLILLSTVESAEVRSKHVPLELDQLVQAVLEEFEVLFASKNIELDFSKIQAVHMFGNPEELKCLMANLLQNALRYTESVGKVTVSLENAGRQARLTVSDTGIGIPPESLAHIFDRFYRVEKSRSRAAGGAGLGLSIVKAIVDAHKGRIEVSSKLGKGSTFTVLLPCGR